MKGSLDRGLPADPSRLALGDGLGAHGPHRGYAILAVCVLVAAVGTGLGRWAYPIIMPEMCLALQLRYAQSGTLASGELLCYTAAALLPPAAARHLSFRWLIAVSLLLQSVAALLAGLSWDYLSALCARALSGVGNAGAFVTTMSLAARWFAVERKGLATGCIFAGMWLGALAGGALVPAIFSANVQVGWRVAWWAIAGLLAGTAGLVAAIVRDHPSQLGLRPLWSSGPPNQTDGNRVPGQAGLMAVLRLPVIWHLGLILWCYGVCHVIYLTFFSSHLLEQGLSAAQAGQVWAMMALMGIPFAPLGGLAYDRLGRRRSLILTFAAQTACYALFGLYQGPLGYIAAVVLFATTGTLAQTVVLASLGEYGGAEAVPAATGLVIVMFGLGQAIGPGLGGAIADATGTLVLSFLVASSFGLLGALAAVTLRPPRSEAAVRSPSTASPNDRVDHAGLVSGR